MPVRLLATNPSGYALRIEVYVEAKDASTNTTVFSSIDGEGGSWDGMEVSTPYPLSQPLDRKREAAAASTGTVWVYDWIPIIEKAVSS